MYIPITVIFHICPPHLLRWLHGLIDRGDAGLHSKRCIMMGDFDNLALAEYNYMCGWSWGHYIALSNVAVYASAPDLTTCFAL